MTDQQAFQAANGGGAGDGLPAADPFAGHGPTVRHDGWTVARQHGFLDDLGDHGNVTRAAAAVGMSASSAYRLRGREAKQNGGRDGAFGIGWRAATAMAYQRLRDLAFERIENGVARTVYYKGELAGVRMIYSDRLLLGMLNHLRPTTPDGGTDAADPADAYAAAMDAFAVAVETDTAPVMPPPPAPAAPAAPEVRPSPGEGPYHEVRAAAARARLAHGEDPFVPRFAGRIYPPHPDDCWVEVYPDGLTADDLAHEDAAELALVGLDRDGKPLSPA